MMRQDLSSRSAALRASRVPFVHARVVWAEPPTSAKPGDEAIVLADGMLEGFVGGSCAEATVRQQSLEVLASGEAVLLRVTPAAEPDQPGKRVVHNPCLSGGTIEVFLEPSLPPPLVQVLGDSPTALALLEIGRPLGYAVQMWQGEIAPGAAALVVASHGKGEDEPLAAALEAGVPYVGLVASRKRGAAVVSSLPVADELKAKVSTPAGLDIRAATAEEVALSILAEIVALQPRQARRGYPLVVDVCMQIDPVCGMKVAASDGSLHSVHPDAAHAGRVVWFCGPGCQKAFLANPDAFPLAAAI
jgi:xanthine dehydrogenase accessory factor